MNILKQSTAATIKLGPFIDDGDGKSAETGLTISQADIRLSKNGGDFAQTNNSAGATADEFGYYDIPLNTTDTGTLGRLRVAVSESGALPVWQDFLVVTANVYDTLCSTDKLDVAAVELKSTQGAITWGQQKIIANVPGEGALDIENTSTGGLGGVGVRAEGEFAGQYNAASQERTSAGQYNSGVFGVWNNGDSTGQLNEGGSIAVSGYAPELALEATLTAIKGSGWTNQTLVKIVTDIAAISAGSGATPQQIWEYATRVLTAGTNIDLSSLATATNLAAVKSVADDILVDTGTTLDGKLNTIDTNVDSILADTGTDGVVVASGQTVATVTNLTNLPTMPADWVTASGLKADAVTEIQSGLALEATLTAIKGAGWTSNDNLKQILYGIDSTYGLVDDGGAIYLLIDSIITHLTDIKGAGWTNQTLVKIVTDIAAISAGSGATPQQIWEYATRTLTAGTNIDLSALATAANLATLDGKVDTAVQSAGEASYYSSVNSGTLGQVASDTAAILIDTGTTLPATLATLAGYTVGIAGDVWSYAKRTLTHPSVSAEEPEDSNTLILYRDADIAIELTDLTIPAGAKKYIFTIKDNLDSGDDQAVLQASYAIDGSEVETNTLVYINSAAAPVLTNPVTFTLTDTNITIDLTAEAAALLPRYERGYLNWDLKLVTDAAVTIVLQGLAQIIGTSTRAIE